MQLCKSLLFLSAGYWGSRAEARVGFDFLIFFCPTLAVCFFFLGSPTFVRKGDNVWIIRTVLPFISVR
jgi:hypothetical protein